MPVILSRLEVDPVARPDELDRTALALTQAHALGDEDRLAVGMGVPRGAGARCEVNERGRKRGAAGGRRHGVRHRHHR